jgi:hypothetical protein
MAQLRSINDPVYATIPAVIERGMALLPGATSHDVELGDALPVRRGRADRLTDPDAPEDRLFEDDESVHVQIFVDQIPRYFARVQRDASAAGDSWRLSRISESAIAAEVEAGLDVVQNDAATHDEVLTLVEVPAYYFLGLMLSGDNGERILPVDFPDELELESSTYYDVADLRERFRSSTILGLRP